MCGRGNSTWITVKDSTKYKANHSENKGENEDRKWGLDQINNFLFKTQEEPPSQYGLEKDKKAKFILEQLIPAVSLVFHNCACCLAGE